MTPKPKTWTQSPYITEAEVARRLLEMADEVFAQCDSCRRVTEQVRQGAQEGLQNLECRLVARTPTCSDTVMGRLRWLLTGR